MRRRVDREGAALLVVLILIAVLAGLATVILDDVRFSVRRAQSVEVQTQARWLAIGGERLARRQVRRLFDADQGRTPLPQAWDGRRFDLPLETGVMALTLRDGQGCFNLNGLVEGAPGAWAANAAALEQFVAFAQASGLTSAQARTVGDAVADWIDSDQSARPLGGEDAAYGGGAIPRRTPGQLLAEVSELRVIRGVDAEVYARLRPLVCALPQARATEINLNALTVADAPLIAMLAPDQISLGAARQAIGARPGGGWASIQDFWSQPALAEAAIPPAAMEQTTLVTRYFDFEARVTHAGGQATRTGLIEIGRDGRARTVIARWTEAD